jgi:hypothetical protein
MVTFVGENAYILSSNLIAPYRGLDKQDAFKDIFNFFIPALDLNGISFWITCCKMAYFHEAIGLMQLFVCIISVLRHGNLLLLTSSTLIH